MGYLQQIKGIMALGYSLGDACRGLGIDEMTYRRWERDAKIREANKNAAALVVHAAQRTEEQLIS